MTRPNSAPAWVDPFCDEAIRQPSPDHTWRRLFGDRVRPKTIPLGETNTPSQTPSNSLTTSAVASIDSKVAVGAEAAQRRTFEQVRPLTELDERIIQVFVRRGGFASAAAIARDVRVAIDTVRKRLDRFVGEERIRNIPGRGYELLERA